MRWLRARAQRNRWAEEEQLTAYEMGWTTRFFLFKAQKWETYRNDRLVYGEHGTAAYAERQMAFWKSQAVNAESAFSVANPEYNRLL